MLLLRDHGDWRRAFHVFLIFAVLVLACNAKITWEFLRSANQALAIRALKLSTSEPSQRTASRKPLKRVSRISKSSTADAFQSRQAGAGLAFAPVFEAGPGSALTLAAGKLSGNFIPQEVIVRPVVLSFSALWRRPPPCTLRLV